MTAAGKTAFTPGPWRAEDDGETFVIVGRPTWKCRRNHEAGEWGVAVLDDLLGGHDEEQKANARLISAAPDMLSALKAMVLNDRHTYRDCHKAALAAIAKAVAS